MTENTANGTDWTTLQQAEVRSKLLDLLRAFGIETPERWRSVLVGEGDPIYKNLSI